MTTQNDIQEINLTIKTGFFYSVKRQLIVTNEFLQLETLGVGADQHIRFEKDDITDYRYGINWIRGYEFTIGREFQIFIRNRHNKILKINFTSLYGMKKKEFHKLYVDILNAIWEVYFGDITNALLDKFRNGENIEVGKVFITGEGIAITASGILKEQRKFIPWEKVATRNYQTYFNIHSTEDAANINRGYSYLKDWNIGVLYSIVRTILSEKQLIES